MKILEFEKAVNQRQLYNELAEKLGDIVDGVVADDEACRVVLYDEALGEDIRTVEDVVRAHTGKPFSRAME